MLRFWEEELTTIYSFTGGTTDGANPFAGLIADANGDLFGTTQYGGAKNDGTAFELVNTGSGYTEKVLHSFTGGTTDGFYPLASLIADANGDLFGTTQAGGANNDGTVFELANTGSGYTEQVLHSFTGGAPDGANPDARLTADAKGDLFGTTQSGGANSEGTVFELVNTGSGYTEKVIYSFTGGPTDGAYPFAGLLADAKGDLFGTTPAGGADNVGTVFELVNTGSGYTEKTLSSFTGGPTDGANPLAGLIADANGDLFGTTQSGGADNIGTVFELVNTGSGYTEKNLYSFTGGIGDWANPIAGLIADAKGDLFGTTPQGGADREGTVFELVNTGSRYTEKVIYSFSGGPIGSTDGGYPIAGLIADANGDLFGTTDSGGPDGVGTVFEITNSGFIVGPPTVSGTAANQPPLTLHPFRNVVISDPNQGQTETVTITRVENAGNPVSNAVLYGLLYDPNAATDGSHNVNGVYTVTGSPAAVTADLEGLDRSPGLEATDYTMHVVDTLGLSATDATTSIIGVLNFHHLV